jgi:hypothetical protein
MTDIMKRILAVGGALAVVIAVSIILALMQHNQTH